MTSSDDLKFFYEMSRRTDGNGVGLVSWLFGGWWFGGCVTACVSNWRVVLLLVLVTGELCYNLELFCNKTVPL